MIHAGWLTKTGVTFFLCKKCIRKLVSKISQNDDFPSIVQTNETVQTDRPNTVIGLSPTLLLAVD